MFDFECFNIKKRKIVKKTVIGFTVFIEANYEVTVIGFTVFVKNIFSH